MQFYWLHHNSSSTENQYPTYTIYSGVQKSFTTSSFTCKYVFESLHSFPGPNGEGSLVLLCSPNYTFFFWTRVTSHHFSDVTTEHQLLCSRTLHFSLAVLFLSAADSTKVRTVLHHCYAANRDRCREQARCWGRVDGASHFPILSQKEEIWTMRFLSCFFFFYFYF